jgi:hypothetical protein
MKFILDERFILSEAETPKVKAVINGTDINIEAEDSAAEIATSTETDWEKLYRSCKSSADFAVFWDKYLASTFGKENVRVAKSFAPALATFLTEAKQDGWTVEDNSIIKFLVEVANNKLAGLRLSMINSSSLTTIIKAYLDGTLTEAIIDSTIVASATDKLLLNCPEFYSLPVTTQEEYLELQHDILTKTANIKDFKTHCIANGKLLNIKQARINAKKLGISSSSKAIMTPADMDKKLKAIGITESNAKIAFACFFDMIRVIAPSSINLAAKVVDVKALRQAVTELSTAQINEWYTKLMSASKKYDAKAGASMLVELAKKAGAAVKTGGDV